MNPIQPRNALLEEYLDEVVSVTYDGFQITRRQTPVLTIKMSSLRNTHILWVHLIWSW